MSEKQQRLVYSIIEFLNQSIDDGTVKADDKESLEVASACGVTFVVFKSCNITVISPMYRRGVQCRSI